MTNPVAFGLAVLIALLLLADGLLNQGSATFFLAIRTLDLIDWVAFWR